MRQALAQKTTVTQRLGRAVYWMFCVVAGLVLAAGASVYYGVDGFAGRAEAEFMLATLIVALIIFLFGSALRYVLASE